MRIFTIAALAATAASSAFATGGLAVTEIMSKSGQTEDWFELTNFSGSAIDITGWSYDDESADLGDAVAISGATSIAAGESLIVLHIGTDAASEIAAFRSFWGGLAGVNIAWLEGASGLGKGDGVTLFDGSNNIALQQFYGMGTAGDGSDEHAGVWAGAEEWDSANSTPIGWIGGSAYIGNYGIFASSTTNGDGFFEHGSLGVATKIPAPGTAALFCLAGLTAARRRR